jgi:hypothetical protein
MNDVTVIIPAYVTNEQSMDWLIECIDSALKQDCQVIVYDDASPYDKETYENRISETYINSEYSNAVNLKIYYGTVHKGVSHARNQAAENVTTTLILPVDCDDVLADGAVAELLAEWHGVPVYPDLSKFGTQEIPHYRLLDFSCELAQNKLGIASVTVLHAVEQWKAIGGWNEHLDLYEDAEYNSRLMLTYCGQNLHKPLLRYRQHASQKTRKIQDTNAAVLSSRDILNNLRRFIVSCPSCGGKRRTSVEALASMQQVTSVNPGNLPGEQDGRILAQYIGGKGQGGHYYKGVTTKFAYKVQYGNYYYVDPTDATDPAAPGRRSLFVKVVKPDEIAMIVEQKLEEVTTSRVPVASKVRTPVEEKVAPESLPDISTMNVGDIRELILTSTVQASKLLEIEKAGRNRSGVISFFEKFIKDEV